MIWRLLVVLLLSSVSVPALALDDDAVRERTREVLANPEYQSKRPDGGASPTPKPDRPRRVRDGGGGSAPVRAPSEISQVLIWIVLGGILVFVAVLLATQARRGLRRRGALAKNAAIPAPIVHGELDAEKLDETLRAAMALATQGRFEEAVHVLLTGAIRELQDNVGLATEAANTSRELLARANLRPEPQSAFRELVFAVEVSLFGGMAVSKDDFERCATSFRTLRRAAAA